MAFKENTLVGKDYHPTDFYMPAEWEPQEGTWLQWSQDSVYRGYELKLETIWIQMVEALHGYGNVHLIINGMRQRDHIASQLNYHGVGLTNVDFHIIPTNDVWARDNGPIFVINEYGETAITDWEFNGWGRRFPYDLDNLVPSEVGSRLCLPVFRVPLMLEGGGVEVNGKVTFPATKSSIINSYRYPWKSQADIEAVISQYLGVRHFIWLTGVGIGECDQWGDETDSHINIVACFSDETTVLNNWTDDKNDPRYSMSLKLSQSQ